MRKLFESHHPLRHANSLKNAFNGIYHAFMNEANFRVQVVIAIFVVSLGFYFKVSNVEWVLVVISISSLLIAELINTALEEFIDHLIKEHHEGAKVIKDLSAGFVLLSALMVLITLILIFGNKF